MDIPKSSQEDQTPKEETLAERFKRIFNAMPQEKKDKIFAEVDAMGIISPTYEEYITGLQKTLSLDNLFPLSDGTSHYPQLNKKSDRAKDILSVFDSAQFEYVDEVLNQYLTNKGRTVFKKVKVELSDTFKYHYSQQTALAA